MERLRGMVALVKPREIEASMPDYSPIKTYDYRLIDRVTALTSRQWSFQTVEHLAYASRRCCVSPGKRSGFDQLLWIGAQC